MKKIFAYITLIVIVGLTGCKKLVEEKPLSDGTLDQFFRTSFDAEAAMAGMYGAFQQTMIGEAQFNNRITFWGDARSDNMERQKQYSNNSTSEVHFNSLSPNNSFADWGPLYTVIGRANLNIEKFPDINKYSTNPNSKDYLPEATLRSYLAQCYAMRAICYFYILRVWGDAPIRTTAFLDLNDNPQAPREPKSKVRLQVLADLQTAYDMTAKGATASVWHIGEGAIAAMMVDLYMMAKLFLIMLRLLSGAKICSKQKVQQVKHIPEHKLQEPGDFHQTLKRQLTGKIFLRILPGALKPFGPFTGM